MLKAYKFRLYPNQKQREQIANSLGCCRFVYNYYLAKRKQVYEETGKTFNYYDCCKDLSELKRQKDTVWLQKADAASLQSALRDLDAAYQNFFRGCKEGRDVGYPRFKSKRDHRQSYTSKGTIKVLDGAVQLPKLGKVKCSVSQEVKGRILSATVSLAPSGKYFVSLCCTDVEFELLPSTGAAVGLAFGIDPLAISSDGVEYPNHRYLAESEAKLAKLQRQLSRKTKGSANWNKARLRVARLHERIANQRKDAIHKISTALVREYDVICIEDAAPSVLARNPELVKAVMDAGWGEFCRQLEYKAQWYGKVLVKVDRPDSSDQADSERDVANNILHEGMRLLME